MPDSLLDLGTVRGRKVVQVVLCDEQAFTTNGTAAYTDHYLGPWLTDIGQVIEDIVIHANGRNFSTNFKYRVSGQYSYDGEAWSNFGSPILTEQTTIGTKISAAWTDRTVFGLRIRFKIGVNDAGAKETGVLSVVVNLKLYT